MRLAPPSSPFLVLTIVCLGAPAPAQSPQASLTLGAPAEVTGEGGSFVDFPVTARLTSAGIATTDGIEGWSIGLEASHLAIVAGTTAGTVGALTDDGGLRLEDGFEKTELTTGTANEGIVSAVVLSTGSDASLPPEGTFDILRLTIRALTPNPVVSGGAFSCDPLEGSIAFVDGLRGSGQPVENKVSYRGFDFRPTRGSAAIAVCPRISTPRVELSLTAPAVAEGPEGGTTQFLATAVLTTADNPSPSGAEGWSIGLAVEHGRIVAGTTAGTAGALTTQGGYRLADGFERTELTTGPGNEGIISAVVLSSSGGSTLPPTGMASLLRVTVESAVPLPVVTGGQFVCEPELARVYFVDGRRGTGQPVENRISFDGLGVVPALGSSTTEVCPDIITPRYSYVLNAPTSLTGARGSEVEYAATARLTSVDNPAPDGAEGWSISIAAADCTIVAATVDGTAGDEVANGGYRLADGFTRTEITTGAGNEGVVSAVVLSADGSATLPPAGTVDTLRLTVQAIVPEPVTGSIGEEACVPRQARLAFLDGRRGAGQPVLNKVGFRGLSYSPTLRDVSTSICPDVTNPFRLRVDVLEPPATAGAPDAARTPWRILVAPGPGTVPVTAGVVLESSLVDKPDGARGFSFSLATASCFGVHAATLDDTDAGELFNQGFQKIEIVNPALNGGQQGVVAAVTLSNSLPVWLPPDGESLVLRVRGDTDKGAVQAPGQVSPPCTVDLLPAAATGLRGTGQPVRTRVAIVNAALQLESREPLVHGAAVELEGSVAGGIFIRGNANDDVSVDLSDTVWILSELFLGGDPTLCKDAADVNDDSVIDISDPISILNFLFLGTLPEIPPPFDACGADPEGDGDGLPCAVAQESCV
jgi:hypothetical protein